jgi:DNA invertase Pin-like site-specific DNA recombinase
MSCDAPLVVWKLDRLERDLRYLINTVHDLTGRGIRLKVLTSHGAAIETTNAAAKLVWGVFVALAEIERERKVRREAAVQDARYRVDGSATNQGRRPVPGTRHHPIVSVPAYLADG